LIEVMIVVAIVAILSALALPSYQDYIQRGKISEATSGLATARIAMEQWYQDHRDYSSAGSPCLTPAQWSTKYFAFTCAPAANTYLITAGGIAAQGMSGFTYTIDETNAKTSTTPVASGWPGVKLCWIMKKGGTC
jgi:type IV pilus assembly protein PilE